MKIVLDIPTTEDGTDIFLGQILVGLSWRFREQRLTLTFPGTFPLDSYAARLRDTLQDSPYQAITHIETDVYSTLTIWTDHENNDPE